MADARLPGHRHAYVTHAFDFAVFADDMAAMARGGLVASMATGFSILASMTDLVIGNPALMQQLAQLQPDLIIGDATASWGHWLTSLTGLPSVEFDVGTSSGLLHSLHGGACNPSYLPAPGTFFPSTGMALHQRLVNLAVAAGVRLMGWRFGDRGAIGRCAPALGASVHVRVHARARQH